MGLEEQPKTYPSNVCMSSYFGSWSFLPERILLTPLFYNSSSLQALLFEKNDNYRNIEEINFLAWTVRFRTPLQMVATWNFGRETVVGGTFVAFDPKLQTVYH